MGYSLIALDIDGTIRSQEYPLSVKTRQTIANVLEAGAIVTVATGRMFKSARSNCLELGITSPIVSSQGAHIAEPSTGKVLWHRPLTAKQAQDALEALGSCGLEVVGYYGDQVCVSKLTPRMEAYGERNQVDVNVVENLQEFASKDLTRLVVMGEENEIKELEAELKVKFGFRLYITRSLPHFCEILHPDSGKDKALSWMCEYLGVDPNQTVAFGNSFNDVQMLKWAKLGVAVGGSVPEVIEVANTIAPPLERDGVSQVLETLLSSGQIG